MQVPVCCPPSVETCLIYLTAIGLPPGGSSTVHIYTQTIPCPVFAMYTLAFALQLRRKHGKTSVRVDPAVLASG